MKTYHYLSRFRLTRNSYMGKFLFVGFLGIHIPLIGAAVYFSLSGQSYFSLEDVLVPIVLLTLLATSVTLWVLYGLVAPLRLSSKVLEHFHQQGELLPLPHQYPDEAGQVMKGIRQNLYYLGKSIQEKKDIISFLSHDLRTPVSQLVSLTGLLKTDDNPETITNYKRMIHQASCNLMLLQENLLHWVNFGYENEFSEPIPYENVDLKELFSDLNDYVKSSLDMKQIRLVPETEETISLASNKVLLRQCLLNMVTNAIKFSHPGQSIYVNWKKVPGGICISVRDEGIGLEPGMEEKIFERQGGVKRSGTLGETSHGFGLYFTRRILNRLGADVKASSQGSGQGTILQISFPGV